MNEKERSMGAAHVLRIVSCFLFNLFPLVNIYGGTFDNLQPVRVATNMLLTEGPCWHPDGYLIFSDINGNVIYKWSEEKGLDTLVFPAGNPNGTVCTKSNNFVICRQGNRDIAKMTTTGAITSYVSQYKGKKLNSPNDLALSYLGSIYFTDPDYGVTTQNRELAFQGLYCIPYNSSTPILLDSTLGKPNGLTFNNDWRTLYVCESSTNIIYSYMLRDESVIQDITKDKKVFLKLTGTGEIDGITSDILGNIYVAFGDGGVKIFDRSGIPVGQIAFTEKVKNLCFGGKYNNILFVTAGNSLYKTEIRFYGDFIAPGLLGIPTDKSIVFNALSDKTLTAYIAYGNSANSLTLQTAASEYPSGIPMNILITGLTKNTNYFYKLFYKLQGETNYKTATAGTFRTQRAKGEVFSFAVEADPHLDEGSNFITYRNTLQNALNLAPDFFINLGDNFLTEKFPIVDRYYIEQRNLLYRNYWDNVCHSMPLFIVQGNHDAEMRWLSKNTADDPFNIATAIRKSYFPTPAPDGFYTGSETEEQFVGQRRNYYAWNWGDALFIVIDPYGYTEIKPTEPWGFTLGKTQYDWFKKTLEESNAKYKFVFAHHLVGGDALGRGGAEKADYYEHGGKNTDGTDGFDTKRPGWGKPLHQIMKETGVQIFFHGHDHIYAEQEKDGIIYQEVPQPSFPSYTVAVDAQKFGYTTGIILPSSGHLNIKLLGDSAQVDYIGGYHMDDAKNGLINGKSRRTYFVKAKLRTTSVALSINAENKPKVFLAGNTLFIETPHPSEGQIDIYTATGRIVSSVFHGNLEAGTNSYLLPDNLKPGVYLIYVHAGNFETTLKRVK